VWGPASEENLSIALRGLEQSGGEGTREIRELQNLVDAKEGFDHAGTGNFKVTPVQSWTLQKALGKKNPKRGGAGGPGRCIT